MTWIGQRGARLIPALAIAAALSSALWMWGFTVDDALISVRYARHLAMGAGYRWNIGGPSTDGVTPLPWPLLLAPLARGSALATLMHACCMGLAAWTLAAGALGVAIARAPAATAVKAVALCALALCIPVAAHAVSGMETGLATALATFAAVSTARPRVAALLAGLAASLRPEMAPWALFLAAGLGCAHDGGGIAPRGFAALHQRSGPAPPAAHGELESRTIARAATCSAIALLPFATCVAVRTVCFGRPAPLALLAKPSDLAHGFAYAGAAFLATLAPVLALSPLATARAPRPARVLALAGALHFVVIAAVGGDWMPYARLAAPVAPSLLLAFVLAAPHAARAATTLRAVSALSLGVYLLLKASPAGRHVMADRAALIEQGRPLLAGALTVAALDAGWPSAATEATLIDLAGLTDPAVAALPGGHTSKRVGPLFLLDRRPDVLLFRARDGVSATSLSAWREATYAYVVEARLVASDLIAERFEPVAFLPLGESGGYVMLKRRPLHDE